MTAVDSQLMVGDMFGKAFESMYTGSMFGSPALDFSVMGYAIACQRPRKDDGECFVELNPVLMAAMFRASEQEVMDCIARLCSPDPRSRSPEQEGRRLVAQTPDGSPAPGPTTYWVVNGKRYRELANEEDRREYLRRAKQRERAAKKARSTSVNKRRSRSTMSTQAEAEAEVDTEADSEADPPQPPPGGRVLSSADIEPLYRQHTGHTDLDPIPERWTMAVPDAARQVLRWSNQQPDPAGALAEQFRWGMADPFLARQPFHVWGPRIGALSAPKGAVAAPTVSDWDAVDTTDDDFAELTGGTRAES